MLARPADGLRSTERRVPLQLLQLDADGRPALATSTRPPGR